MADMEMTEYKCLNCGDVKRFPHTEHAPKRIKKMLPEPHYFCNKKCHDEFVLRCMLVSEMLNQDNDNLDNLNKEGKNEPVRN